MDRHLSKLHLGCVFLVATSTILPLFGAFDGVTVSSEPVTFRSYIVNGTEYALTNTEDIIAWPVTWKSDEVVTAAAMDGTTYVLSDVDGGTAKSATLPEKGGVWCLFNSEEGSARISVPWSVCQGVGISLATSAMRCSFSADTLEVGPNRKNTDRLFPPISYSGDDWAGDAHAASELMIEPPPDKGLQTSSLKLTGTGIYSFLFDKTGKWTITIAMDDGMTRTAIINNIGGTVISFR